MAKFQKVKRYKKIYRSASGSRRATPLGIAGVLLGVVALAVLGWSLYDPIYNFLMGNIETAPPTSSASNPVSTPGDAPPPAGDGEGETPTQPAPEQRALQGVYMPVAILQNEPLRIAFLDGLAGTEINAVLFDLKDVGGNVTYQSTLPAAQQTGTVKAGNVPLATVLSELKARGLTPIGRIHAFKDPVAPYALKGSEVRYQSTEWTWLDNSREMGGKPWLNPFAQVAQDYILDLVEEAAAAGVTEIVLDSVHFPTGFSLDKANYGRTATPSERTAVLTQFVKTAQERAGGKGANLRLYLTVPAVLGTEGDRYGENPAAIPQGRVALGAMPSLFGNAFSSTDLVLENPVQTPYDTVKRSLDAATQKLTATPDRLVFLQAYTATNVDPLHNKAYAQEDFKTQIQAAQDASIPNYILYNPTGTYTLEKTPT